MARSRDIMTLQKLGSAHASIDIHLNHNRHLNSREPYKQNRSAALAEWRPLAAQNWRHRVGDKPQFGDQFALA